MLAGSNAERMLIIVQTVNMAPCVAVCVISPDCDNWLVITRLTSSAEIMLVWVQNPRSQQNDIIHLPIMGHLLSDVHCTPSYSLSYICPSILYMPLTRSFWVQRVKGQGHSTSRIERYTRSAASYN